MRCETGFEWQKMENSESYGLITWGFTVNEMENFGSLKEVR